MRESDKIMLALRVFLNALDRDTVPERHKKAWLEQFEELRAIDPLKVISMVSLIQVKNDTGFDILEIAIGKDTQVRLLAATIDATITARSMEEDDGEEAADEHVCPDCEAAMGSVH